MIIPSQTALPRPPTGLKPAGKRLWEQLWGAGWLHPSDEPLVTMLCRAADEMKILRAAVNTEGRWFTNRNGQVATHPAVRQLGDLEDQVTEWFSLLGVSPMARARLGIVEPTTDSRLDELDARRRRTK